MSKSQRHSNLLAERKLASKCYSFAFIHYFLLFFLLKMAKVANMIDLVAGINATAFLKLTFQVKLILGINGQISLLANLR